VSGPRRDPDLVRPGVAADGHIELSGGFAWSDSVAASAT
jgi:hypothetical protein